VVKELRFDEVTAMSLVAPFLGHSVELMFMCDRRRCWVEQVVPRGAANVVHCNGLSAAVDDDDDVICLDDDPVVMPNHSQHAAGFVA